MKILYYSNLVSPKLYEEISETTGIYSSQAIQKFHRLLSQGLESFVDVKRISSLPIAGKFKENIEIKNHHSEKFHYLSTNKNSRFRQFANLLKSFFFTLKQKNINYAIFDYLNITVSLGGWLACKIKGIKTVLVVTDLPNLMVNSNKNFIHNTISKLQYKWIANFDSYILLTDAMSAVVNPKNQPYMVMEGLVDSSYTENYVSKKENIILYAGGLYAMYGVKKMIDAFLEIKLDYELHLYGSGDLVEYIQEMSVKNNKIKFFGSVDNKEIVEKLPMCTLLVNPRPSTLELAKYSFPSKNMEYMVSGTPVLTAKLPGMPLEYHNYVYLLEDETVEGITESLTRILNKPESELRELGNKAKNFVLKEKSNVCQAQRIIEFMQ